MNHLQHLHKLFIPLLLIVQSTFVYASTNEDKILIGNILQKGALSNELIETIKQYSNNPKGWSALNWAIGQNDYNSALIIVDYCSNINKIDEQFSPLNRICKAVMLAKGLRPPQIALIKKLISKGADVSGNQATNTSPLATCCSHGLKDQVEIILNKKIDINQFNGLPLRMAIRRGDIDFVQFLIKKGANPVLPGTLKTAVLEEQYEIIDIIIKAGGNVKHPEILHILLLEGMYNSTRGHV